MKKLLIILLCFLSTHLVAQTDTALGVNFKKIPLKSLNLLHPLYNPNDSTAAFDSARYYLATFDYNGTKDSLVITFLDGTRLAVPKPSSTGSGSGWKTVNTNDMTDTLSGNVGIGTGVSTPIAKLQINVTGINATQPDSSQGLLLINPDAATSGNQKFSSIAYWQGSNWRNGASLSSPVGVGAYVKTVQGNTQGVGYLTFYWRGISAGIMTNKTDLLTIGAGSEGYGWGVGINATPYNTAGAILNLGGGINQVSGNYTINGTWNINAFGSPIIDYSSTTNYLRLLSGASYKGVITDKPVAVGRNDSTDLGAQFSVTSTGRGFLFPRMTTTQRDSINLRITGINIVNGGTGYTSNPSVTASVGPVPTGATTATFSGTSWTITGGVLTANTATGVVFGGSYNSTPTLTLSGGGGSGAVVTPIMTQFLTEGMTIYNLTTHTLQTWTGSTWHDN